MIVKNVNYHLINALDVSRCFMYAVPHVPIPLTISVDRILSIYKDLIAVYNADKCILSPGTQDILIFIVKRIDEYSHIFTFPLPIDDRVFDLVKVGSMEALEYTDDDVCEVIALAFQRLISLYHAPNRQVDPRYLKATSCSQLPNAINDLYRTIPKEDRRNNCEQYPLNAKSFFPMMYPDDYLVPHQIPAEELQMIFDPNGASERGRFKAGYNPNELSPTEIALKNPYIKKIDAVPYEKVTNEDYILGTDTPIQIGSMEIAPVASDEEVFPGPAPLHPNHTYLYPSYDDTEHDADIHCPMPPNQNPIGYIEESKNKNKK